VKPDNINRGQIISKNKRARLSLLKVISSPDLAHAKEVWRDE